jgi:hypothetical protein
VVHADNLSYSGGGDQEDHGLRSAGKKVPKTLSQPIKDGSSSTQKNQGRTHNLPPCQLLIKTSLFQQIKEKW